MRGSDCFESIGDVWAWWIVSASGFYLHVLPGRVDV